MPLESNEINKNHSPATLIPQIPEKFLNVERGDVDLGAFHAASGNATSHVSSAMQQNFIQANQSNAAKTGTDPVEFVKKLISTGFTPSRSQIINSSSLVNGPYDSANTWFALFLQRLLKQKRIKNKK